MKKIFVIALTAVLSAMSANAQSCDNEGKACCGGCEFQPTWFFSAQGGIQLPNTPGMSDLISPVYSLGIGRNVTPIVSVRGNVEGWKSKVYNEFSGDKQNFKYATGSFDAMVNLFNLVSCKPRALNLYGIAGVGLNISKMATNNSSEFSPNLRLGAQLDWAIAKDVSLNLEYRADNTNDQFNGRLNNGSHDWYTSLFLGVSVRLGNKAKKSAPVVAPAPVVTEEKKPEPKYITVVDTTYKKEPVTLHEEKFYAIRESESTEKSAQMSRIANFLNSYKDATIIVVGYADKGTGSEALNKKYAQKRADSFKKELVEKYNIDANRIATDSKGDSVQPFAENDKNRCVIIDGKAEKTVMETKSRQVEVKE